MILNLLFLIPLFIIGIICNYTDIKYGKIRNKVISFGFIWVIVLYIFLGIYNQAFLHQAENLQYLKDLVINGLIALLTGYLLWNFKLLAAGDAKLFTLYAFLIPPQFYSKAYFPQFPSFVLLINIFIPLLLFLSIKALFYAFKNGIKKIRETKGKKVFTKESLKKLKPQIVKTIRVYITFLFIFIMMQLAMRKILESLGGFTENFPQFYLFLFIFFIYRFLLTFISRNKFVSFGITVIGIISAIYLLISGQTDFLITILKLAFIFMVFVGSFYRLLNFYIEQKEIQKVKIQNLKKGMFPSIQEIDNDLKNKLGSVGQAGLTRKQVDLIQAFFLKNPDKELKIYKTFALSPFIFLGAVISIFTSDSLIAVALRILHFLL